MSPGPTTSGPASSGPTTSGSTTSGPATTGRAVPRAGDPGPSVIVPIPVEQRAARLFRSRPDPVALVSALVLIVAAFGVRAIGLIRSFELWVDEMLYASLGASVARGELPNLPDGPFFLHPPGFFLMEAGAIHAFGLTGNAMALVFSLRWLSAACGAVSVGLVFLILRRSAGLAAALVAGVVAIFEPFVLRNNSRVFLETAAMLFALVGLAVVVEYLAAQRAEFAGRRRVIALVGAGLAMGYAVLSKDVVAVYTVVPVVLAVLWRATMERRDATLLIGAAAVPYAIYMIVLAAAGRLGDWVTAKTDGLRRMLGFVQATGFNAPGSTSLADRVIAQVSSFGTSYVLLMICPVAGAVAALSARPERRLVGLTALVAGLFGLYTAAFGTFEEQYGYPVVLTAILATAVSAVELSERRPRLGRPIAVTAVVFMVAAGALGIRAEATTDDGYLQVRKWISANLPAAAKVGVTNSTGQLAFRDDPRFGLWASIPDLADHGASYLLTQSQPITQGYGFARPEVLPWLAANATPVIAVPGPTNGVTTLWYIGPDALRAGAAARIAYPAYERER